MATIPNDWSILLKHLRRLGAPGSLRCCCEAGPTGYGPCRDLVGAGIECIVVAPSLVPVQSGNKVKTDRRDAVKLAHFLRSGDLTPVHVPDQVSDTLEETLPGIEKEILDRRPEEWGTRYNRGRLIEEMGRRAEAERDFELACRQSGDPRVKAALERVRGGR
ncbi:MAG: transposase [Planctomycetes bacterium]|nr:transposase [Planctomycetota bacterium]